MKSSEYFTKPVAVESSSREIAKAKMRVRNYWSILILLLILLLLFLMLRVIWYAPKLTATLGIKDENKDYKGEINIIIDPTEWTNGDVLVSVEYNKIVENAKKEISIDGGNTFVEYTEPIKVAQNTKIVARLVGVDDSNENEKHTANDVGADVSRDPQNDIEPEIIAEESLEIKNIDKLEPLDFNITASSKDDTILVGAKAEDAEETEENGKSEIKEYEYIIRRGDWEKRVVSIGNTCKFDKLQGGQTYKIQVYAIDNAGNKKASNEVEVTIKELARLRINPNGGTWEGSDKVKEVYQEYGTTKKIEEPTRIGYTFKKWVATDGGSIENNTYTFGEANGTITAEWEINQYTLTFDPNGGAVTPDTITENYDTRITMPSPTKTGYTVLYNTDNGETLPNEYVSDTFIGWYTDLAAGTQRTYATMPALDETLYAHWNKAKVKLPTLSKTGYTLEGWYEDSAFTTRVGNAGEEAAISKDVTLYAKWEINKYTLSFDANEGEVNPSNITEDYNSSVTMPTPIREYEIEYNTNGGNDLTSEYAEYDFLGWYTDAVSGEKREYTTMPAGSETLYAHWDNTSAGIALPSTTKAGYTFEGWYEDSSLTKKVGNAGDNYSPNSDITLFAKWKANEYTLTLDPNGGTVTPTSISAGFDTIINLPVPTKQYSIAYNTMGGDPISTNTYSYNFLGWYTDATSGTQKTYTKMPAVDETLYAHWNASSTITLPTPTKAGYTFDGWYEEATLTTKVGDAGENYAPTSDTTLYAKWTINEHTLTFDANGGIVTTNTITANFDENITMPTPSKEITVNFDSNGGDAVPSKISTYDFLGWYTDKTVGEKREYTKMPAVDETLYAHWNNTSAAITLPKPSKAGYTFSGWYEEASLTTKVGNAGENYTPTSDTTLYAKWTINEHTLTLDANGGTVTPTTITAEFGENINLPTPIKEYTLTYNTVGGDTLANEYSAYNFIGWYTDLTAGEKRTYTTMPALDETLYAHWDDTTATISLAKPTKIGYTFAGWYEDNAYTNKIGDVGTDITLTKDTTIYAKWNVNQYTLTFDPNGGNIVGVGVPDDPYKIIANYNDSINLPTPTKTGYTFAGWYEESNLTTKVGDAGDAYTITNDATLYAKWAVNPYTLTLDPNGGTVTHTTITAEFGENINLPTPIKEYTLTYNTVGGNALPNEYSAYNFIGWYTDLTAGDKKEYTTMPALDETLYAHWDDTTATISLAEPTKIGYTFAGWYEDNTYTNKIGDVGTDITLTKDTTIYAKWNVNQYTLTFDPNGGNIVGVGVPDDPYKIIANYNDSINLPTPTKLGYTFIGWYEDSALTTKIGNAGDSYTITKDINLYANWKINEYTLTFDAVGGTVTPDSITEDFNTIITLPLPIQGYTITYNTNGGNTLSNEHLNFDFTGWYTNPISGDKKEYTKMPAGDETLYAHWDYTSASISLPTPTKAGYTFAGWYEDSTLATKAGDAGESYTTTEDITLYAKWNINQYTLTLDANGGIVIPTSITKDFDADISLPLPVKGSTVSFNTNGGDAISDIDSDYTFIGWYTETDAGEQKTYTKMPAGDETLYAHWDSTSTKITLPLPTKAGYTFAGWYEDSTLATKAGNAGDYYTPAGDVTLYADWQIAQYTITFDATGGTLGDGTTAVTNPITQNYNSSLTLPTATKDGYKFAGWYSNSNCADTNKVGIAGDNYTILADATLYAKWDKLGIYVKLYSDGELVFTDTDRVLETKTSAGITMTNDYGDITGKNYSNTAEPDWFNERLKITTVDIVDEIAPLNTSAWFNECNNLTIINNIANLDTSKVTTMSSMFSKCSCLTSLDVTKFDTSKVTTMNNMFNNCSNLTSLDLSNFNTSKVTHMASMFNGCSSLTSLDVSNFDTSSVTNMNRMFARCSSLTSLDLSSFDTSKVTIMTDIFDNCTSLTQITFGSKWNKEVTLPTPVKTDFNFTGWYSEADCINKVADGGANYTPPSAITIYAGMAPNIYVKLYSDGTLAFTATDRLLPDHPQTGVIDYGNIYGKEFNAPGTQPWYKEMVSITSIDFVDPIQPTSTGRWFQSCTNLTTINNITNLDTSKVTDMLGMFAQCRNLTSLDLSSFDTSNLTWMLGMFSQCNSLTYLDVSKFNTSNITDMSSMFHECNSLTSLDLSSFDTSNVTNMTGILTNCTSLEQITFGSKWNKEVTLPTPEKPDYTFTGWYSEADCINKVADGGATYTPNGAITIYAGFAPSIYVKLYSDGTLAFTATDRLLPDHPQTGVIDYGNIYGKEFNDSTQPWKEERSSITSVDIVDKIQPTSTQGWFIRCNNLTSVNNIANLDTSKVTSMMIMFYGCSSLPSVDVSNFDTSNVTITYSMFYNCSSLTELNVRNFNTSNVTSMANMFNGCSSLTKLDLSSFNTSNLKDTDERSCIRDVFNNCTSLEQITFGSKWNKEVTLPTPVKENYTFTGWYSDSAFTNKVADGGETYTPSGAITIYAGMAPNIYVKLYSDGTLAFTSTDRVLAGKTLSKDYGNIAGQDFNVNTQPWKNELSAISTVDIVDEIRPISTKCWFVSCSNLTTINNIANLDTSKVTNMAAMFSGCSNLTNLDVSKFNTSNVVYMSTMFSGCSSLTSLDISKFNTSKVTSMTSMFSGCSNLTNLDVSKFDTSNVTDMNNMFANCSSLTNLNLSSFNTSKVTNMAVMFYGCSNLTSLNVSNFNTSNVTMMYSMFANCSSLTNLDLSSFNTSKVTHMGTMFSRCSKLTRIYVTNNNWSTSQANTTDMFANCGTTSVTLK